MGDILKVGQVFVCSVCGSELSIVKSADGQFAPVCCDTAMEQSSRVNHVYVCPECGAEMMVLSGDDSTFNHYCCDIPMELQAA
ncbi:MAG: hypothetical protein KAR06_01810 [Deltaproteobacteria bacterium]|nr:hypothetical protein [Deltaproteobacteria bacterium]